MCFSLCVLLLLLPVCAHWGHTAYTSMGTINSNIHTEYLVQSNRNYAYWFLSFVSLLPLLPLVLLLLLILVTRSPRFSRQQRCCCCCCYCCCSIAVHPFPIFSFIRIFLRKWIMKAGAGEKCAPGNRALVLTHTHTYHPIAFQSHQIQINLFTSMSIEWHGPERIVRNERQHTESSIQKTLTTIQCQQLLNRMSTHPNGFGVLNRVRASERARGFDNN